MLQDALWIWPTEARGVNQYVEFRHEFEFDKVLPTEVLLSISADSQYVVRINGRLAGTGQYTGFPDEAYFNEYPVSSLLHAGRNVLTVTAHCCGVDHFSYIASGRPGVIYNLQTSESKTLAESGTGKTLVRISPTYRQGEIARLSNQLPYTFEYDGTKQDGWQELDYAVSSDWRAVAEKDCVPPAESRQLKLLPIAHWRVEGRVPAFVIAQGVFQAGESMKGDRSVGAEMQRAFLSSREPKEIFVDSSEAPIALVKSTEGQRIGPRVNNAYIVIDLEREEAGFVEIELTAARGTIVDIAYSQHLTSLRVRAEVGGRHFASRYHCAEGRQSFTHWAVRASGRYLQLHLHGDVAGVVLHYAGLRPAVWPSKVRGAYNSPDRLDGRIFDVSTRTLQLCMHEHYEDTPWREQGLYANDSLIQALCGYYALGEYAFPAFSFELLGKSLKPDGWLEMCAPARMEVTIPSFSISWVIAVGDHLLYSGDQEAAAKALPVVESLLDGWLAQTQGDLLPAPEGKRFWHFYDWSTQLNGCTPDGLAFAYVNTLRFDAALNGLFILALESGALLAETGGATEMAIRWREAAAAARDAFHLFFWQPEQERYATFIHPGTTPSEEYSELVQALAICADTAVTKEQTSQLRALLSAPEHGLIPATLSQSIYTLRALAPDHTYRTAIINRVREAWGDMMLQGATSCWETQGGAWDFGQGGSLCHGWSTLPLFAFGGWVLGIRPTEPGFRKFTVDPDLLLAPGTSGRIPTPYGPIEVSYSLSEDGEIVTMLTHPSETTPMGIEKNSGRLSLAEV